jgi:hypothetical protein
MRSLYFVRTNPLRLLLLVTVDEPLQLLAGFACLIAENPGDVSGDCFGRPYNVALSDFVTGAYEGVFDLGIAEGPAPLEQARVIGRGNARYCYTPQFLKVLNPR